MTGETLGRAIDRIAGTWDEGSPILLAIAAIVILALYLNAPGVIYGW